MDYLHCDLGVVSADSIVVVDLNGTEANVQVLDDANFHRYRRGDRFQYVGGHYRRSPARISVPRTAHWHVAIDLGGAAGRVAAAVSVVPSASST